MIIKKLTRAAGRIAAPATGDTPKSALSRLRVGDLDLLEPQPLSFDACLACSRIALEQEPTVVPILARLPLVLIHNRKAAGTTFATLLGNNCAVDVSLQHHVNRFGVLNAFEKGDGKRRPIASNDWTGSFHEFVERTATAKNGEARCVFRGHITICHDIFAMFPHAYLVLTCLRHPIDLIHSLYRYNRRQPLGWQSERLRAGDLGIVEAASIMARSKGVADGLLYRNFLTEDDADDWRVAYGNLRDRVAFFAIAEDMSQSLRLCRTLLGLEIDVQPNLRVNASDSIPLHTEDRQAGPLWSSDEISQGELDELRAILRDDIAFYRRCVDLYEERKQTITGALQT